MKNSALHILGIALSTITLSLWMPACANGPSEPVDKKISAVGSDTDVCSSAADCDADEVCNNGKCTDANPCSSAADCAAGEVCNNGECE